MPEQFVVTASGLNLRSEPVVKSSSRLVTLPEGQIVTRVAVYEADPAWWRVTASVDGASFEGFVKHEYLDPADAVADVAPPAGQVRDVHLTPKGPIRRDRSSGRAYPLNEGRLPRVAVSVASLTDLIDWLAVDQHARYLPANGETYCNIYAYDYCYFGNAYLPRVWWTSKALQRIAAGEAVPVQYDKTVREMNANSLHNWLVDYGQGFGWRRVANVTSLQSAANAGQLAIICAKRKDLNRSGHIVAVVPETAAHQAKRTGNTVRIPVQSQAGSNNFRYGGGTQEWWTDAKFSSFGFWISE